MSSYKDAQLCLTLCDPMEYAVHGILQARILERAVFPFSRGSSQPSYRTKVSHIAGGFYLYIKIKWTSTWKVPRIGLVHIKVLLLFFEDFPGGSDSKAPAWNVGDLVRSLAREDSVEKKIAIHSSTLAWKITWTEEPGMLHPMGSQRVRHDWGTKLSLSFFFWLD